MKRILFLSVILAGLFVASCEKEEVGGTATKSLAGQWYITIDAVDADGNVMTDDEGSTSGYTDYFGTGRQVILTYNTAANTPSEMYLDMSMLEDIDYFPFVGFKVLIPCSASSYSFGGSSAVSNMVVYDYDYSLSDTTFVPADTVLVEEQSFSCLEDTIVVDYDSIYVTYDTIYLQRDTTFITQDTLFIGADTTYLVTKTDTILSPLVIDTVIYDSIGVFFAYYEIVPADTIVEALSPIVDNIKIWNGKVTLNGAVTPSGMPADAIEFEFSTDGDDVGYYFNDEAEPGDFRMGISFGDLEGFDHYKVTGYRYTGFADDDE